MSKWNKQATVEETIAITNEWVQKNCPLIYIYAPSKTGKTTLLGSLLKTKALHEHYCPVFAIDGDQGLATIADFNNEKLITPHVFDKIPDALFPWTIGQFTAAQTADCNAIFYEGLTSVYDHLYAKERVANPGATGNAARRLHIGPSQDLRALIQLIRQVKQYRMAKGTGVPIFVTLNTKDQPIDNSQPDSGSRFVPAMSKNLVEKARASADAFLELTRSPSGTRLITKETQDHPFVALRYDKAARAIQSETNLSLPGLLALWATTIHAGAQQVNKHIG